MTWPIVSDDSAVQALYEECRRAGTSHTLAEVFAFQKAPESGLDDTRFMGVIARAADRTTPEVRAMYEREARAAGVSTTGRIYEPSIASPEPGMMSDPKAWVGSLSELRENANRNHIGIKRGISEVKTAPTEGFKNSDEKLVARRNKQKQKETRS